MNNGIMSDKQVYAGIDIGGTNVKFGLVDHMGNIIHKEQRPTMAEKGAMPLMHMITNIAERLLLYAVEEEHNVEWLGVGTPGAVDFRNGKVIGLCPNIDGWQGMEIGEMLRERLNMPVWVDNDVNAMALAETRFGSAKGAQSVVCLTVGTGIGGAIIIDGKIYRGSSYSAGELGHMTINFDGPQCRCGNHGCLEAYCASHAIIERTKKLLDKENPSILKAILDKGDGNLTIKKIFSALKKGDGTTRQVMAETARYLGVGLAGIVNLLNPETVVIGGGIIEGGGGFLEAITAELKKYAFDSAVENLNVVKAALGNDAGFIGAGLLGLEK